MARDLKLAMTLLARDQGSKVLRQSLTDINRQINANKKASDDAARSEQENLQNTTRGSRVLQQEYRRAASARETLGIRSERTIQREISQTQAAYMRLLRTGTMTAQEQSRAFDAMTRKVATLRNELNGTSQSMSRIERAKMWGGNAMAIAGGVTAATMVIKDPVQRQMAYEYRNADIANTAYNNLSAEERIKKMPVINNAIRNAVRHGGGTPEAAQETLGSLFANGLDEDMAMKVLPDITRYASASGANPVDLAKIGVAALKNFGIKPEELSSVFDKAIRSGENGKYELPDMAGSLALTLSKANKVGMSGLKDFDKVLAALQANAETAGENGEATTNYNNYLDKLVSSDTQNSLKDYRFRDGGKLYKYTDFMAEQRGQGVNASDAFMKAVNAIVNSDSRVKKLRSDAKKFSGTAKGDDLNAALNIVVSSITSKIMADAQANSGLNTNITKKDFIEQQVAGTQNAVGAGESSFKVKASTPAFKSQQLEAEKLFAEQDAVSPLSKAYGEFSTVLAEYMQKYPELSTAISGATIAIKAMTGAALSIAMIRFLGNAGRTAETVATASQGASWMQRILNPETNSALKFAGRWAGRVMVPLSLYQAANDAPLVQVERGDAAARARLQSGQDTDTMSRLRDLKSGQPGLLDAWDEVKSWWSSPTAIKMPTSANGYPIPPFAQPAPAAAPQPQIIQVMLPDGKVLAEAVNDANSHNGSRGPQGGPH